MNRTPEDAAFALFESGRMHEAESAWREILARQPDHPDGLHMLGYILATTGRPEEGLALLDRAVERSPRVAGIRSNRAVILHAQGRDAEAERDARRALDLEPRLPAALHLIGNIRLRQGRREEAVAAYRKALGVDPDMAEAHFQLATIWDAAGEWERAEAAYRNTIRLAPKHVAAMNDLGVLLRRTGREPEAVALFERALALGNANAGVLNNLGISRTRAGRFDEAFELFGRAVAARPGFADALANWGNAIQETGDLDGAARKYDEALRAQPDFVSATYALAQIALRQQRFADGWRGNEARIHPSMNLTARRETNLPRLAAEDLDKPGRVAVWTEQGLGDQILYSTLLAELEGCGKDFAFEADPRLVAAYRRRFPGMRIVASDARATVFEGCDRQIPLASLPGLFRPDARSFERQPAALLAADQARVARMRERLGQGRWIAIGWRSLQKGDREEVAKRKSIPLETFAALAGAGGARLLDLQYGDVGEERAQFEARHPGVLTRLEGLDTRNDLEGVLAAIAACDHVVTSSNALAHLAGAIGKPTWLLLLGGYAPFHYWWGARPRSLWYPSVEIVSDPSWTRWEQAVHAVADRLRS